MVCAADGCSFSRAVRLRAGPDDASSAGAELISAAAALLPLSSPADFAELYSDGKWQPLPHLRYTADTIADVVCAGETRIVIVEQPPRHGKSELVSHWLPAWFLSLYPQRHVIEASYEATFAAEWGRKVRNTLAEIGTATLAGDSKAADLWHTAEGGGMQTAGVGGPITGKSAHLFVIDDPIKNAEEAESETMRNKQWNWWHSVAWTRREPGTVYVVMMTRWHEDDLIGRLLAAPEYARFIVRVHLPALAHANDQLGRKPGEALWPAKYPADDSVDGLLTTKATLPARWWLALFDQSPAPEEGAEILRTWWQWYDELPVPREKLEYVAASWDCTFKDKSTSDWVVGQVWGVFGAYRYLLEQVRARMGFVDTAAAILAMHNKWRPNVSLVELAANGDAIVETLQGLVPAIVGESVQGKGGKVARARAVTQQIRAGQVYLPRRASFAQELVEECAAFPLGKHDDQVDALSQALNHLLGWQSAPTTHLTESDNRFVPPHIKALQERGVLGGLGRAPQNWRL